jgi:hypothetical protein
MAEFARRSCPAHVLNTNSLEDLKAGSEPSVRASVTSTARASRAAQRAKDRHTAFSRSGLAAGQVERCYAFFASERLLPSSRERVRWRRTGYCQCIATPPRATDFLISKISGRHARATMANTMKGSR